MPDLDSLVHYTYKHLFDINPDALVRALYKFKDVDEFVIRLNQMKDNLPAKITDDTTFYMIEIAELFKAINRTRTITGAATLFRSLVQSLDSLELIHAKQDSVKELEEGTELTYKLKEYINLLAEKEKNLYQYFFDEYGKYTQYDLYHGASEFFRRLVNGIKEIPKPETKYLEILVNDIKSIDGTRGIELIKGPVYATFGGFKTRSEIKTLTPRAKFTLRSIKPTLIAAPFLIPFFAVLTGNSNVVLLAAVIALTMDMSGMIHASEFDYEHFTLPLRDIYVADKNIRKGIDAIGKIDELLSFHGYYEAMRSQGVDMTMPVVTDISPHYFVAKKIRNPILLSKYSYCVPNDVALKGQKITLVTGPQGYGKSTCFKTVTQIQAMAQIGCYVPAEEDEAEMGIADHIFYQRAKSEPLEDPEGTFGVELRETRDYYYSSTKRSLVVLDRVLAGATTNEEAFEQFDGIMHDFYIKGNNTVLITFDHKLVKKFKQENIGQYLKINPDKKFELVPGISTRGGAASVAERLGFSPEDRRQHLIKKGYIKK